MYKHPLKGEPRPSCSVQIQLSTGQVLVLQSLRCICAQSACESNQFMSQPAVVCLNMHNRYNICQRLFEQTQSFPLPVKLLEVMYLLDVVLKQSLAADECYTICRLRMTCRLSHMSCITSANWHRSLQSNDNQTNARGTCQGCLSNHQSWRVTCYVLIAH